MRSTRHGRACSSTTPTAPSARYYLDLFGASHLIPYEGTNPVERLTARVTLAFFDRYVLGQPDALETMTRDAMSHRHRPHWSAVASLRRDAA